MTDINHKVKSGKIAVIGDKDSILMFKAAGVETFAASNVFEVNELLRSLSKADYAVIYITEECCILAADALKVLKSKTYPAVIPIPSLKGSIGYAAKSMRSDVEKAIGADIIFNDKD